jgi:hypothetical protein
LPARDLSIFADLGLEEMEPGVIGRTLVATLEPCTICAGRRLAYLQLTMPTRRPAAARPAREYPA